MIDPNFPPMNGLQIELGLPSLTDEDLVDGASFVFEECDECLPEQLQDSKISRALAIILGAKVENSGTVDYVDADDVRGNASWSADEDDIKLREAYAAEIRNRVASRLSMQGRLF